MTDIGSDKNKGVICHCSGTTKKEIKKLVDDGFDDLDKISRMTGACSGCAACENAVLELLVEFNTDGFV